MSFFSTSEPERSTLLMLGEGLYELGLDDAGGELREGFGGDAANAAVMAARMGAPCHVQTSCARPGTKDLGPRIS